jgi:hypothetical protein
MIMKKVLILTAILALCLGFSGGAKADTCPVSSTNCLQANGVTYTFSNTESDGGGVFDVTMTVGGSPLAFSSFSVFFSSGGTNDTSVTLESAPGGTSQWTAEPGQQNTNNGCSNATTTPFTCFTGGSFAAGTYVFDVTDSGAPDTVDLKIGQGTDFALSNTTGVGTTSTPEPASLTLLGLGLLGAPFLRRKK